MTTTDMCVIFNSRAGRGKAAQQLRRLRQVLGGRAVFRSTQGPCHAEDLARQAARDGFPLVAAAGGDGTVHEVANGLLQSGCPQTVLAVYPIGSANDYACSLGLKDDWWARPGPPLQPAAVDVGQARASDGRQVYFVNNLGIGLTGMVALQAEQVPFRGLSRYLLALLNTLCFHFDAPLMSITLDGTTWQEPTLALSLGIGCREGNFQLVPQAQIDDGLFDFVRAGALTRLTLLRLLPAGIRGRLPTDLPGLALGRCRQGAVRSEIPLVAHLDGECFCQPRQEVRSLEVDILPRRLQVLRRVASDPLRHAPGKGV